MYELYEIVNELNGKRYIGYSNDIKRRWRQHKSDARCRPKQAIHKAMHDDGIENFSIRVLDTIDTREGAGILEDQYINERNTYYPNGYNKRTGGDSGYTVCEDTRQLMIDNSNVVGAFNAYNIIEPDGNITTVDNLEEYCVEHDLNYNAMIRVANGWAVQHQGYTVEHVDAGKRATANENLNENRRSMATGTSLKHVDGHTLMKDGVVYKFDNIQQFCIEHDLAKAAIGLVLKGKRNSHKGFVRYTD